MFTEVIIQRQGSKSRAAINKIAHSHTQFDVQLHVCPSRHACSQTASFQFNQTRPLSACLSLSLTSTFTHKNTITHRKTVAHTHRDTMLLLTSTKELQVADLLSDLQLEDLLEDLLPQRLLDDSHPLQLLPVQTQQRPPCRVEEGYMDQVFQLI